MELHKVDINFAEIGPSFFIKIDGKEIRNVCGVIIKSPMIRRIDAKDFTEEKTAFPIVQIAFYAEVKGTVTGEIKVVEIKP